jgi:hypothetical protein
MGVEKFIAPIRAGRNRQPLQHTVERRHNTVWCPAKCGASQGMLPRKFAVLLLTVILNAAKDLCTVLAAPIAPPSSRMTIGDGVASNQRDAARQPLIHP